MANSNEHHVHFGGDLVARLYKKENGKVTVDLSPHRGRSACKPEKTISGLKELDLAHGEGSFTVESSIKKTRKAVLKRCRPSEELPRTADGTPIPPETAENVNQEAVISALLCEVKKNKVEVPTRLMQEIIALL